MEGVAERRQQIKIFGGKKEKQNKVYMLLKEKPRKKKASWKVVIAKIFKLAKRMKH